MSERGELFGRFLAQTSDAPLGLEIARAEGSWLYAQDGRRYLDFIAGIGVSALGHGHPAVLAAIEAQARRHLHVMVYGEYVIESQVALASRLADLLPAQLERVYFTNSGAEAIEGALKTARKYTGRRAFIAFDGAYHGDTMGALALSGNATFRAPFEPLPGPVRHLPWADTAALSAIDESVAAVVIEPVQAEGGVRIPSRDFIHALRERCDRVGALLIFDEVLTGMGRTGRLFALEHFGVVPDLIVLAKALGGGLPLGAFCGRDEVLATLAHDPPLGHITTFGGHPLSCAAGLAALEVIVAERLWERAEALGTALRERLSKLIRPTAAEVRGLGLLIGIEFDSADRARRFVAEAIARGVIVNWTLNADRVVRLAPPLTIREDEVEFALGAMTEALETAREVHSAARPKAAPAPRPARPKRLQAAGTAGDTRTRRMMALLHDLRSPVAALSGFVGIAQDPESTEQERASALARMGSLGRRMKLLIDNLEALTRLEQGIPEAAGVLGTDAVASEVARDWAEEASSRNATLTMELRGGAARIKRVDFEGILSNLLAELIGRSSGEIRLETAQRENRLAIKISGGPATDAVEIARLFEAVQSQDTGGSGRLGLQIARMLVEAYDGKIAARADSNGALVIAVDIPLEPDGKARP